MSMYLVSYDLHVPGQKYEKLAEAIKSFGGWAHVMGSTWLVDADRTSVQAVYDKLRLITDDGDRLMVNKITRAETQGWLAKSTWDWFDKIPVS